MEQPSLSTNLGGDRPLDFNFFSNGSDSFVKANYNADASSRLDYFGYCQRNISRYMDDFLSYAGKPSLLTNVGRDRLLDFNCFSNGSKTYNVVDYNASASSVLDCFAHPQRSISSYVNTFSRYAEFGIHSETSRTFNSGFSNDREMQGRVGNLASYYFYNMAYAPRRMLDGDLYSVDKDSMSIERRMLIGRMLRDHGQ